MRHARFAVPVILALALCIGGASAQTLPAEIVKGRILLSHDKLRQGSGFQLAVVLNIGAGYHIYSTDKKAPVPTVLKMAPSKGFVFGKPIWPTPESIPAA